MTVESPAPLAPEEAARLTEFARACKAAARAVILYPNGHPAIAATLGRIAQVTSAANLAAPMRIGVLADMLPLDGRAPARSDPAIGELAAMLHDHLVGEITVHGGGDIEAWRIFLLLLGRAPDAVRAEGGISRLWTAAASRHVELREIDYTDVLREREGGQAAVWAEVIENCLQGDSFELTEETLRNLLEIAGDPSKLGDLIAALDEKATATGRGLAARTEVVTRLLRGLVDAVRQRDPERLEPLLKNVASAFGRLTPEMLVGLLSAAGADAAESAGNRDLVRAVADRMTEGTIAHFVARNAAADGTSQERLVEAFHSLVRGSEQAERLLALAHQDATSSPLGSTAGFEDSWEKLAQKMLTSYSDKPFVSEAYARELSNVRTRALDVGEVSDDPPERCSAWLATVATSELRRLDLTLVLDLLRLEQDTNRLSLLMRPIVTLLEDLILVGDFEAAAELVAALVALTQPPATKERRQTATTAIDFLVSGPTLQHILGHLATMDEAAFAKVKTMCVSLGEVLVRPLATALSTEQKVRTRERLTSILIAFGSIGRREVERLKSSPNPTVRRTAIYLLREFGGSEALPELTELLDDSEQAVQREAVRAILNIGTDQAFAVLQQALAGGTARSREAIMQSLLLVRDERATPLFSYILRHVDHRGELGSIYLRAIEVLGELKDPGGVPALKEALYRGEWWARRRTVMLRNAAAASLSRIDTPEATAALEEAVSSGPRGVRAAARRHLRTARRARSAFR
jgi:hypothetical protein